MVVEKQVNFTSVWTEANIAIVLYLPRKESARKPPSKHRRKDVPRKSVTMLAEVELARCIVPTKYVTRFTAIPMVESLSHNSISVKLVFRISFSNIHIPPLDKCFLISALKKLLDSFTCLTFFMSHLGNDRESEGYVVLYK